MKISEPIVKEIPAVKVLSKRGKGLTNNTFPHIIGELMGQIHRSENAKIAGPPMYICYDEVFNPKEVNFEIGFPISGELNVDSGFEVHTLPQGKIVSIMCTGPYSKLKKAYEKLFDFVKSQGYQINGQLREIYHSNPQEISEDQLVTELQIPIT
ncbi:MAG: GyrI-like domain-containing protein [Candidatus Hodarchaeota archaeon]